MMTPQEECDQFNRAYPVGTDVFLRRENGLLVSTRTATPAQVANESAAIIFLEGIGGFYLLHWVTPFDKVLRVAGRRTMDPLKNALEMTGCKTEEDLIDMAKVGQSLMERIGDLVKCEGPFKNWSPADDPAEIVFDLYNALEEALEAAEKSRDDIDAALREAEERS